MRGENPKIFYSRCKTTYISQDDMTQINAIPAGSAEYFQSIAQTKPMQLVPTNLQKRFLELVAQCFSQLSLGQDDTKMLKRNYIKKKKKNSWSFRFQIHCRICSPSEKVLRDVGAGEGEREYGESTGITLCKELFCRWSAELGVLSWMRWGLAIFKDK